MSKHIHIHIHTRDEAFQGSEQQWRERVKAKYGHITFRPRLGLIWAKDKDFNTVGEYDISKKQGTIN